MDGELPDFYSLCAFARYGIADYKGAVEDCDTYLGYMVKKKHFFLSIIFYAKRSSGKFLEGLKELKKLGPSGRNKIIEYLKYLSPFVMIPNNNMHL